MVAMIRAGRRPAALSVLVWAAATVLPLAAYAQPLWQNALADTPIAYLIWIPVLAMAWAAWNLLTLSRPYPDDGEVDLLLGGALTVSVGLLLALGAVRWPGTFVYHHVGLLLWPLWALGLGWLYFGLGATGALAGPLAYLLLAWPPVFTRLADATQGMLTGWAVGLLNLAARRLPWLAAGRPAGVFWVTHGAHQVPVVIAQACSGADSLLGAAILLPVLLTWFRGPWWRAGVLGAAALGGALVVNWARLLLLVGSEHWIGSRFTFGILHPALGFILFAVLGLGLALLAPRLGLHGPGVVQTGGVLKSGPWRQALGAALAAGLFFALWPLFSLAPGGAGRPVLLPDASARRLLPAFPGWSRAEVYRGNESSVLGLGAVTLADAYRAPTGGSLLAEVWSTPDGSRLASYGFHNCLLYHGDVIRADRSFALLPGVAATAYAVRLPPLRVGGHGQTYVDVEWSGAVRTPHGIRYLRWSVAAFPQSGQWWPRSYRRPPAVAALTGLAAVVAPPARGQWPAGTAGGVTALEHFARSVVRSLAAPAARR